MNDILNHAKYSGQQTAKQRTFHALTRESCDQLPEEGRKPGTRVEDPHSSYWIAARRWSSRDGLCCECCDCKRPEKSAKARIVGTESMKMSSSVGGRRLESLPE